MEKIKASIAVISYQNADEYAHPFLMNFMKNLNDNFDEVIFVYDCGAFKSFYAFERHASDTRIRLYVNYYVKYKKTLALFIGKLREIKFSNEKKIIIAIDDFLYYFTRKYREEKIILWSWDLFSEDNNFTSSAGFYNAFVKKNKNSIESSSGIIIHDSDRLNLFQRYFDVKMSNYVFLPESRNDCETSRIVSEKKTTTKKEEFTIVQSGYICSIRGSEELLDAYNSMASCFKVFLRGYVSPDMRDKIHISKREVRVSENIIPADKISETLGACDIGFVGYKEKDQNHRYIIHASGQFVEYIKLGMPVISFASDIFNDFVDRQRIGASAESADGIARAAEIIVRNYNEYSKNARKLYENSYRQNSIFNERILDFISREL